MQLKRGIAKDDGVVIMGKSSGIPAKQDDGNWAVIFYMLDAYGSRYAGGEVVIIFSELPSEFERLAK